MSGLLRQLLDEGPHLSVGILTADLLRLGDEIAVLEEAQVGFVHVDVMDGVFCPQTTVGPPLVRALPKTLVKDVHLLVEEPLGKVDEYVEAGVGILTVHIEASRHPHRVLQSLGGTGVLRGVALNPGTPLGAVEALLDEMELLLVLAVNPGFPGQAYLASTDGRLAAARRLIGAREIVLAVDGGITKDNIGRVAALGVDLIVSGSAVFDGVAPLENARSMLEALRMTRRSLGSAPNVRGDPPPVSVGRGSDAEA